MSSDSILAEVGSEEELPVIFGVLYKSLAAVQASNHFTAIMLAA